MILSGNLGELNKKDAGIQIWKIMEFLQSKIHVSIKILQTKFENISEIESVQFTKGDMTGKEMDIVFTIYLEVDQENKEDEDIEVSKNDGIIVSEDDRISKETHSTHFTTPDDSLSEEIRIKDNLENHKNYNLLDIGTTLTILEGLEHFKRTETGKHVLKMMELLQIKMNATKTLLLNDIKDNSELKQTDDHEVKKETDIIYTIYIKVDSENRADEGTKAIKQDTKLFSEKEQNLKQTKNIVVTTPNESFGEEIKTNKSEIVKGYKLTGKHFKQIITGPVGLAEGLQLRFDQEKGALVEDVEQLE